MNPFPEDNPNITTMDRLKIEKFCTFYYDALEQIKKRKFDSARSSYVEMLRTYEDMKELSQIHLNVAHHCLREVHGTLNNKLETMPIKPASFRLMMVLTVIVLLVGVTLVVTPKLSGLVVYEPGPVYNGPNSFFISGLTVIDLNEYFSNGDLSYLVTSDSGYSVELEGSKVYIIPKGHGIGSIEFIAFDMDYDPPLIKRVNIGLRS